MARRTVSVTESETLADFSPKFPAVLDIKPDFTIELPGKHVGLIFKDRQYVQRGRSNEYEEVDGYRYLVRNSSGKTPPPRRQFNPGEWMGSFYETALMLRLAIDDDIANLTPATRARKEVHGYDD